MSDDLSRPPTRLDSVDALLATAVAAPPSLPEGTVVGDCYEVRRVIGSGGMGTVYLAHDRTLGREVALKLHRATSDPERLRREAVAMARLAHPNVVTVFEVGVLENQTFVAMEYVPGETLRVWAEGRGWRDVLGALIAAGEGLVAVHAAGLVHRDVKPDNILVGTDGRVRVGDFGLARTFGEVAPAPVGALTDAPMTSTGAVLGTPAYMAPEQLAGARVDARGDQFAFCVAAWEMLCGGRPFPGDTLEALRDAIVRRDLQRTTRDVPARIRGVLARGLAAEPSARWPDMAALLRALRAAARGRRVLALGGAAIALVGAGIAYALWPAPDPAAGCDAAGADIERILPASVVAQAVDPGPARDQVTRAADALRARYRSLATHACVSGARGAWTPELVAASRECLAYDAATARELLAGARSSGEPPADVAQVALALPDLSGCGDARLLAGWHRIAGESIIAARARLDAALHLIDLGRVAAARRTRDEIATTAAASVPEVANRLDLLRALIMLDEHDYAGGEKLVTTAYYAARGRDDGELALLAARHLIDTAAALRHDPGAAGRWSRDGIAEAEANAARLPVAAAAVYIAAANAANDARDSAAALADAARAEQLLGTDRDSLDSVGLLGIRAEALAESGKLDDALRANEQQIARMRAILGADHPVVATVLAKRISLLLDAGRDAEAQPIADEALALLGSAPAPSPSVAIVETNVGAALTWLGDPRAEQVLDRARAGWVAVYGEDHPDVALIDVNLAVGYMDRHDYARAQAALKHAIGVEERTLGPDHVELAIALFNLAVAQREAKDFPAAIATARRCAAIYTVHLTGTNRHQAALGLVAEISNLAGDHAGALAAASSVVAMPKGKGTDQVQAWGRLEGARALIALHQDPGRARTWLTEARALYAAVPLPKRLTEIDGMLAKLR